VRADRSPPFRRASAWGSLWPESAAAFDRDRAASLHIRVSSTKNGDSARKARPMPCPYLGRVRCRSDDDARSERLASDPKIEPPRIKRSSRSVVESLFAVEDQADRGETVFVKVVVIQRKVAVATPHYLLPNWAVELYPTKR
jgi:hypothetical protein